MSSRLVFFVWCLGWAGMARADSAVPDPKLEQLIAEAVAHNPDLRASDEAVAALKAAVPAASTLPNPTLGVLYTNDGGRPSLGSREMTTLGMMATQPLVLPAKRHLMGQQARLVVRAAEWERERVKRAVIADLTNAYFGLLEARERLTLLGDQEEAWQQFEEATRARYSVGRATQVDLLRAQVERARVQEHRAQHHAEAAVHLADLNRLLARSGDEPFSSEERVPLVAETRPLESVLNEASNPELQRAELDVERSRLDVALAQQEGRAEWAVQAGYMNRGGLDPMWQAGVLVSLPVRRQRPRALIAEAEARLRASEARLASTRSRLRARTAQRLAEVHAAENLDALYASGLVEQDKLLLESTLAAYSAGGASFVAVAEAQLTIERDRAAELEIRARHARARARLDQGSLETDEVSPHMPMGTPLSSPGPMSNAIPSAKGEMP